MFNKHHFFNFTFPQLQYILNVNFVVKLNLRVLLNWGLMYSKKLYLHQGFCVQRLLKIKACIVMVVNSPVHPQTCQEIYVTHSGHYNQLCGVQHCG